MAKKKPSPTDPRLAEFQAVIDEAHKKTGCQLNLSINEDTGEFLLTAIIARGPANVADVAALKREVAEIALSAKLGGIRLECWLDPAKHEQAVERAALIENAKK